MLVRRIALSLVVVAAACVTTKTHWGPAPDAGLVDCRAPADECPSAQHVILAERTFRFVYPDDDLPPQRVLWRPRGTYLTTWGVPLERRMVGTHGPGWIECSSWDIWRHERIHRYLESKDLPSAHPGGIWIRDFDRTADGELKILLHHVFLDEPFEAPEAGGAP